jgi:hypothetical protein
MLFLVDSIFHSKLFPAYQVRKKFQTHWGNSLFHGNDQFGFDIFRCLTFLQHRRIFYATVSTNFDF